MNPTKGTMGIMDDQVPPDRMRAADVDRERVAEQLQSAHAEGRLDLTEYDQRVQQAWTARTYGELAALTADLPQTRSPAAPQSSPEVAQPHPQRQHSHPQRQHCQGHRHRRGRCAVLAAWATASLINLMIWAIVSLTTLSWLYPWWIWVAGPWGVVLLVGWLASRGEVGKSPW